MRDPDSRTVFMSMFDRLQDLDTDIAIESLVNEVMLESDPIRAMEANVADGLGRQIIEGAMSVGLSDAQRASLNVVNEVINSQVLAGLISGGGLMARLAYPFRMMGDIVKNRWSYLDPSLRLAYIASIASGSLAYVFEDQIRGVYKYAKDLLYEPVKEEPTKEEPTKEPAKGPAGQPPKPEAELKHNANMAILRKELKPLFEMVMMAKYDPNKINNQNETTPHIYILESLRYHLEQLKKEPLNTSFDVTQRLINDKIIINPYRYVTY